VSYKSADSLSSLDRHQLEHLDQILTFAQSFASRSRALGTTAPSDPAWSRALADLEATLALDATFPQVVKAALKRKLPEVLPISERPQEKLEPSQAADLFASITSQEKLYPISWHQFEHVVAQTFAHLGFDDVVVLGSDKEGDGGIDITMAYKGSACIAQCKHLSADDFVKIEAARALAGVAKDKQATAYLVSTGKFGHTLRQEMYTASPQVFVIDGEKLWKWILHARGKRASEEIFYPGRVAPKATPQAGTPAPAEPVSTPVDPSLRAAVVDVLRTLK
jgi:hypothetical protein